MKLTLCSVFAIAVVISFSACNSTTQSDTSKNVSESETNVVDSLTILNNMLIIDSLNDQVRVRLATKYYIGKDFDKAIFHFLKVYTHDNKNMIALLTLGNLYYDTQEDKKAIIYYQKYLALDSTAIYARCDMATCYLNIKQPDQAKKFLLQNLRQDPNHIQSHHNLSVVYKELGMIKEANAEMEIFTELSSK